MLKLPSVKPSFDCDLNCKRKTQVGKCLRDSNGPIVISWRAAGQHCYKLSTSDFGDQGELITNSRYLPRWRERWLMLRLARPWPPIYIEVIIHALEFMLFCSFCWGFDRSTNPNLSNIHIERLYGVSSRKLLRGAPNFSTAKRSSLKVRKYACDKVL